LGHEAAALTDVPAGITSMRSGSLSLSFTTEAANARLTGDLTGTQYGQEYAVLLRRNRGGPLRRPDRSLPVEEYNRIGYPW
jgi:hypothetical protein